jgi:hypothetical protein
MTKKKVCACSVQTQSFLKYFQPTVVESKDSEPTEMESRLYINVCRGSVSLMNIQSLLYEIF